MEATAASGFAIVGGALAIWGASRGAAALQTALNEIHDVKETRPWWRVQAIAISTTLGVSFLILLAFSLLVFGPLVEHKITERLGHAPTIAWLYSVSRWVGAAVLIMIVWACLYYYLPNIHRRFRWVTPGAVVGVLFWLAASRGFTLYTDNFGSYDKTYGTLGEVIVFITWLWMSSMALLIGGQIDDAIDDVRRQREASAVGAKEHPQKKEERTVERDTRLSRPELALTDLARRVGDDLSTLAKNHFELARAELSAGAKKAMADAALTIFGGIVALVGLAMLCVSAVVAAEPLIAPLWLRLFLGALLYLALGGGLAYGFVKKLSGEEVLPRTRAQAQRTARALKEQVQHG
jgi:YihY family inner membrane protein